MEFLIQLDLLQTQLIKKAEGGLNIHGLSFSDFMILYHLHRSKDKSMRRIDLAEKIGVSASGVTKILRLMEKTGLVKKEKNARDARVSSVKISKAGEEIFQDARVTFRENAEIITQRVSDDQLEQFIQMSEELL